MGKIKKARSKNQRGGRVTVWVRAEDHDAIRLRAMARGTTFQSEVDSCLRRGLSTVKIPVVKVLPNPIVSEIQTGTSN